VIVTFAAKEPVYVENPKLSTGYMWTIPVIQEGVKRNLICSKSILQHIAAALSREKLAENEWDRLTVGISAQFVPLDKLDNDLRARIEERDPSKKEAKMYNIQVVKITPKGGVRGGVATSEL